MKRFVSFGFIFVLLLSVAAPVVFASDTDIVLNEFQLEPAGSSQWVELYNKGTETIDITSWVIDDNGGAEKFTIPNVSLSAKQCVVFQSGAFNLNTTTSDTLNLKKNEQLIDSYTFEKSPGVNTSFGRAPDGEATWTSFIAPTRESLNATGESCAGPSPTPTITPLPTTPPSPTLTKTPTPTRTPTPTKIPTPSKIPTATKTVTATRTSSDLKSSPTQQSHTSSTTSIKTVTTISHPIPTAVLGTSNSIKPSNTPAPTQGQVKTLGFSGLNPSLLFILGGGIILITCGIVVYMNYKRGNL